MMTIYEQIGDENLHLLVDTFYDKVLADDRIAHLFTTDIALIKEKQFMFLSQFLGGPARYTEVYGHPKLRMRHLPHQITKDGAMAWLECMAAAVESLPIDEGLKEAVFCRFPKAAAHMVNV